jgi:hypothetical protein
VGPWPWSLLNLMSALLWFAAVTTAWKSAGRVVKPNRPWTRAWRILVSVVGFSVNGIVVPLGAVYVLVRYRPSVRRARPTPFAA